MIGLEKTPQFALFFLWPMNGGKTGKSYKEP